MRFALLCLWATVSVTADRDSILQLIGKNPKGHLDVTTRAKVSAALTDFASEADPNDILLAIGSSMYGWKPPQKEIIRENEVIVPFEFMKQFIQDVFESYGVPAERAATCADVLIESDKRGIDSHGLGRLKPIYCDRMDQGILYPSQPIDIIKETETTALLDGNLGMGLYIGP